MTQHADRWSLVVPVKRVENAKTRLTLDVDSRAALAIAMAVDTVAAALASEAVARVVVVTDDRRAREALGALDVLIVADEPDAGLNAALAHGAASAPTRRVAALASDLPALRAVDVASTLTVASSYEQAVVADLQGTGTTLLCAADSEVFTPRFGIDSLAAHVGAGATDITAAAPQSVRRDVDTLAALRAAAELGLGPATRAALETIPGVVP